MISSKPLWGRWDDKRVFALDVALSLVVVSYAAWAVEHGDAVDVQYAFGVIVGIVLLRARDYVAVKMRGEDV